MCRFQFLRQLGENHTVARASGKECSGLMFCSCVGGAKGDETGAWH